MSTPTLEKSQHSCNDSTLAAVLDTVGAKKVDDEPSSSNILSQMSARTLNSWQDGYPAFPEFAVSADEVTHFEDILHSCDLGFGVMNEGNPTDPECDAVLLIELLPRAKTKFIFSWMAHVLLLSFLALIVMFSFKLADPKFGLHGISWYIFNCVLGSLCLIVAVVIMMEFARRLLFVQRHKMRWSAARKRLCRENAIQVVAMVVANVFWVVPSIYVIASPACSQYAEVATKWFAVIRRGAHYVNLVAFLARAWNINEQAKKVQKKETSSIRTWAMRLLLVFLWLLPIAPLVAEGFLATAGDGHKWLYATDLENCTDWTCKPDDDMMLLLILYGATLPIYFLVYLLLVGKAYRITRSKAYTSYRMANMLLSLTMRQNLFTFVLLMLSQILLVWVYPRSCATATIAGLIGPLPSDLAMNGVIVLPAILFMPAFANKKTTQQYIEKSKENIFAWLERDKNRSLDLTLLQLEAQPTTFLHPSFASGHMHDDNLLYNANTYVFCFETALKCLYWNWCVYLHNVEDSSTDWGGFDIATAMQMYGMRNYEVIEEPITAVKCLMGWNDKAIIMAFRGTVCVRNCYQNIKFGATTHQPRRNVRCAGLRQVPCVHTGFACSWYKNDFNKAVLQQLSNVCKSVGRPDGKGIKLLVTGHSLGAAMAMVAALDASAPRQRKSSVTKSNVTTSGVTRHDIGNTFAFDFIRVYTFGCPHVGNTAFATDYDARVPDTWNIINDQDAVARSAKFSSVFIRLFERPGHKVLVNKKGEMLVAPSALEKHLNLMPGFASWDDHVMSSYDEVLLNVCKAQFTQKGRQGGLVGMLSILQNNTLRRYYHSRGLDVYAEVERVKEESTDDQPVNQPNSMATRVRERLSALV